MSATVAPGSVRRHAGVQPPALTALVNILLGPVALAVFGALLYYVLSGANPAFDFRHAYWAAGHRVIAGESPYKWTPHQFRVGLAFVYPALSALVFAPLSLASRTFGSVLSTFTCIGLVPATLWILRVRDWRVYGITVMWLPVFGAWQTANETMFLVFGLACLWRYRDRPLAAALLTAAMISLKPLLWPLALWLLATRRWRASGYTLACGIAFNLIAWSLVGFGQVSAYLHATAVDMDDSWRTGYGLPALAGHLGLGRPVGEAALVGLSAILIVAVMYAAFIKRRETEALILAIALALISSPLVWSHYFALLLVPLALLRPRLNWLWALPVLMWVCPPDFTTHAWQAVIIWLSGGTVLTVLARQARMPSRLSNQPLP
jgi:alpha-1,2-mannosyltransferase